MKIAAPFVTSASAAGVWSNSGGALTLIAQQGSQAPGCATGVTFSLFNALALPDQGGVVFLATLNKNKAAGVTAANNIGIWAMDTSGQLRLIVKTGQVVNGKTVTGLSFLPIVAHVGGQSRNVEETTGDLIYEATYSDKTDSITAVIFP
jgi:hypothetical protein